MKFTALVFGATGLIGQHLVFELIKNPECSKISVIGRSSCGIKHHKLIEHLIDLSEMENHQELFTGDTIFCCLGTTMKKAGSKEAFKKIDSTFPLIAARLGQNNGVSNFYLVSSVGADLNSRFFYLQVKGETERAILELGFKRLLIFRPAGLLGKRKEFRLGEKVGNLATRMLSPLMVGPLRKSRPIQADRVAYVMAQMPFKELKGPHLFESDDIEKLYQALE